MDRSWMYNMKRATPEFRNLVNEKFVRNAVENAIKKGETRILCPCIDCDNLKKVLTPDDCVDHLVLRGFKKDYTQWIFHGESILPNQTQVGEEENQQNVDVDDDIEKDRIDDLLEDVEVNLDDESRAFEKLLNDAKTPLYRNCDKFTRLSVVLKLMSLKVESKWSDKSFTALLELLADILPEGHVLPISTYEAKKVMCPFKHLLQIAFRTFKAHGGSTLKSGMSMKWSNIVCPQQPGSTECGYYVMRYMLDVVRDYRNIKCKEKWFGSKVSYTREKIDEVRELWADYFINNYL